MTGSIASRITPHRHIAVRSARSDLEIVSAML
jgi:hypothetical protein